MQSMQTTNSLSEEARASNLQHGDVEQLGIIDGNHYGGTEQIHYGIYAGLGWEPVFIEIKSVFISKMEPVFINALKKDPCISASQRDQSRE